MNPPLQSMTCSQCATTQDVPAPSPRGPSLRLRCHDCGAALGDAEEVTRVTGALEVPSAPVDRAWYVVVEGEVVGPATRAELERYHRAAVIPDDAPVWHAGFGGWAPLHNTTTFSFMVGGRRAAPRRSAPAVQDLTADADLLEPPPPPVARQAVLSAARSLTAPIIELTATMRRAAPVPVPTPASTLVAPIAERTAMLSTATTERATLRPTTTPWARQARTASAPMMAAALTPRFAPLLLALVMLVGVATVGSVGLLAGLL